jgi:hypothetical protein
MKYFSIFLVFFIVNAATPHSFGQQQEKSAKKTTSQANATKKTAKPNPLAMQYDSYVGKWYGIEYPLGWLVRPSLKDSASGAEDSIFFTSPDSLAEFYVYCPRYTGKPKDIEINKTIENQLGQTLEEERGVRIRTVRIQAKDSSYIRFIEDTEAFIKRRRLVFGLLLKNQDTTKIPILRRYNAAYLHFKQSFRKFAD